MSPHLPGERAPAEVQDRETPGRRSADLVSFGNADTRRSVAVDAMRKAAELDNGAPQPGYPYARRTEAEEEEAVMRDMATMSTAGVMDLDGNLIADPDEDEPDAILPDALLLPADHDGAEAHGPFRAGALAAEAAMRSGDLVIEPAAQDESDDGGVPVFIDVDTGEAIDPADLDGLELVDGDRYWPPA